VVVDASGADSDIVERVAMHRLLQAGAVLTTWLQFACEVMGDWQTPEGPEIGKLINRIAGSFDVRGDRICGYREYFGDIDPEVMTQMAGTGKAPGS